ncbi:MAG TPA: hypothetical protein VKW78_20090 [Terriglobales bacterium]|nr:hypothetical protein [Terriglobales bacterium]
MFEQELELEKGRGSWGPLLLVIVLIGLIVGGIGYYVYQMKKGLSQQEASGVITDMLKAKSPKTRFRTGTVMPSIDEKPKDPHYQLLQKAGLVTLANAVGGGEVVKLTDAGESLIKNIPGEKDWKASDGTIQYEVPLAVRKLVSIDAITMTGPSRAKVDYTWQWDPNRLGQIFDASGDLVQKFNTWDRGKLIQQYGSDFYHPDPKKESVFLIRGENGWKLEALD